jgi:hypothetical protein
MSTQADVRRMCLSLPATSEDPGMFRFLVEGKAFAWIWLERTEPKGPRVPNPEVIAVRVANASEKDALIDLDGTVFFTEPHYANFPAVLVRLPEIDPELLRAVLTEGWRRQAPKRFRASLEPNEDPRLSL